VGQGARFVPASLNTQIAGVILAGGKSSRMGTNKALLPYRGARLIDYIAYTMKDVNLPVYVSGDSTSFNTIPDLIANIGPLGGVISSVEFLHKQGIQAAIFVPVDMPYMSTQLLTRLMTSWNKQDAIHYHHYPLPLLLNFSPAVLRVLRDLKINHTLDRSIKGFIKQLDSYSASPTDDAEKIMLTNVNTAEDWKLIQDIKSNVRTYK
jgi:molybdopterin-guanine dinucleotide biosynthesis protein A